MSDEKYPYVNHMSILYSALFAIKWKNPYFENNGAVLKLFVAKNWIDIFFYRGYELDEFQDTFRKENNSKMRAIKIEREDSFD